MKNKPVTGLDGTWDAVRKYVYMDGEMGTPEDEDSFFLNSLAARGDW